MLHVDVPTRSEIEALFAVRATACVSIYLRTTPLTHDAQQDRIELKNLAQAALKQLVDADVHKKIRDSIEEAIGHLIEDDEFWRFQANSLAVLATEDRILTFRLATHVGPLMEVSDRFHLKPLLRAITVPQSAYVLALGQNSVRLLEVTPGLRPAVVKVPGMPESAPSSVGRSSLVSRGPLGRMQGTHGKDVWLTHYCRQIDAALRPLLAGTDIPLILAAAEPLASIYRTVNAHTKLAAHTIGGNPEKTSDQDLDAAARPVLDQLHKDDLARVHEMYSALTAQHRTSTDLAQIARAATHGVVSTLLVDIDEIVDGTIDDEGKVTLADKPSATTYGVVDQIAGRALSTGARVLSVRRADIPNQQPLAAIFRYKY
jgi:hypothetical protein